MTGTVIGAIILGIPHLRFYLPQRRPAYQEIIKGGVIVAAVIADQYRQRRRKVRPNPRSLAGLPRRRAPPQADRH